MPASAFSRLYRKVMARVLGPLGFQCREGVFWRERDGLLHIVSLDRSPFDGAFTVDVAVQPLVYPFEAFMTGLGARLYRFKKRTPHRWTVPAGEPEMEQMLGQFGGTVVELAVPWLDRFQCAQDIVETQARNKWGLPILADRSSTEEIAALCALDAGMLERGRKLLQKVYAECYATAEEFRGNAGRDVPERDRKRRQMYQELLGLLEKGDLQGLRRRLEENKAYTRAALGIG